MPGTHPHSVQQNPQLLQLESQQHRSQQVIPPTKTENTAEEKLLGVGVLKHKYILKLSHNFHTICMLTCLQLGSRPLSNNWHSRNRKHCRIASYIPIFHVYELSLFDCCGNSDRGEVFRIILWILSKFLFEC